MADLDPAVDDCLENLKRGALPLAQAARALGLDGLALVLTRAEGLLPEPLHLHGPLTERVEDLQLVHGQGPSIDAAQRGHTLLVSDLTTVPPEVWLGLVPALTRLGIGALFAFPLRVRDVTVGALTGYRTHAQPLTSRQLTDALAFADATAHAALSQPRWLTDLSALPFSPAHQAAGTLAQRHRLSPEHAWLRLRSHALTHNQTLLATARTVLNGDLPLEDTD
ncbi:GAF and ANTAR domain-containing protein [Streptomyces olivaceiscleroticus]|uniref:GAF and ANTAR domain-containing protein n=1 Tax=Streptomyces olivaceiscleroticus TaxID=68245 RepID=UPI0031F904C7